MSDGKNNVLVDIKGRVDGPGGLKQAANDAKKELAELREEAQKGGALAAEAGRGQQLMALALGAVGISAATAAAAVVAYAAVQLAAAAHYLHAAENLGTLAERYEMTTEQISVMRLEAELGNTSIEKVAQAYQQVSIKMLAANSGNKEAIALFKALGVEYADGAGKLRAVDAVMNDLHDRFAGMESGAGRGAVAAKLLGKALSDDLMPWLTKSSEQLAKVRTEAEQLGLKISTETSQAAKEFNDNLKVLTLSASGLGQTLAVGVIDNLVRVTERMREARKEGGLFHTVLEGLRQAWNEFYGQGSAKQELEGILAKRAEALDRLGVMVRNAESTGDSPQSRRARNRLQAEVNQLEARRDRLALVLAINNPTGYSDGQPSSGRTAAPDSIPKDDPDKKGRAGPIDTGEQLVMSLQKQLAALSGESSKLEEVYTLLADGTKKYSVENANLALDLAATMDAQRKLNDESKRAQQRLDDESKRALQMLQRQDAEENAATDSHKRKQEALEREAQAVRESLDPWAVYGATHARLNELLQAGLLTHEQYTAAVVKAGEKAEAAFKGMTDTGVDGFKDLQNAVEGWGRETSRTLAKAAIDGKISFESLGQSARNFFEELLAIQIKKRAMDPLLKAGTNWLDGMFNGAGSGGAGLNLSSYGPAFASHSGRGPGDPLGPVRFLPSAVMAAAPRLHSGIGPGEMPAVIRRDESVLTPGQMRAMGTPKITVIVNNPPGQPMQAQASAPRFDGEGYVVDVFLTRMGRDAGVRERVRSMLAAPR